MKNIFKKIISLTLALCMLGSMMIPGVSATGKDLTVDFKTVFTNAGVPADKYLQNYPDAMDAAYETNKITIIRDADGNMVKPNSSYAGGRVRGEKMFLEVAHNDIAKYGTTALLPFKFIAPGTGDYTLSFNYAKGYSKDNGGDEIGAYILAMPETPYDRYSLPTPDAESVLTKASVATPGVSGKGTAEGTVALEEGKEYIIVFYVIDADAKAYADFSGFSLNYVAAETPEETTVPEETTQPEVLEPTEPSTEPTVSTIIASGTCGSNAQWSLDTFGTLRIYGTGPVSSSGSSAPWYTYRAQIKNIIVADTITGMPSGAFYGLSSLESITIPFVGDCKKTSSDTYQYPFGYIFGTSSYTGGVATKQNYYGSSISYTTNSTYYIPSSLKSVTVTGGEILYGAFYNCSNLTSVTIGDSVTSIGSSAFYGCSSLTSVVIGDSVESIGDYAFYGCSRLTSVVIPDSVTSIGYDAFRGCSSLTSIEIPDSVTSIGNYAFYYCSGLTSVVIGDSVTSIGSYAFSDCSSLKSVVIGDSVESIGDRAFYNCRSLTSVYITDLAAWCKISFSDYYSNPLYYAKNLYLNETLVTDLVIPDSVTSIGDYEFYNCSNLTSVVIPDSVTSIGQNAFYNCSSLTSVVIGDSVESIGDDAFLSCSSLESVVIGDSVTSIGSYAFYDCSSLTSVVIPESVTSIGSSAFSGCSSLTSVVIGDSVESIGSSAFYNCSRLESVVIGDSVTSIGADAFYQCSLLESVVIPDSVESIGSSAFYKCSSLESVVIGDSVESIGSGAFRYCSSLESVVIGDSVESIGYYAFEDCSSLTSVYIADLAAWCKISFPNLNANPLCYAENLYLNGELLTNLVIPDSVTSIGDYAFYNCSSLTSIEIPDSITSIGAAAFSYCNNLTGIWVGTNNSNYCSDDFGVLFNKSKTTLVRAPSSIIGSYTVPNSVTSIGAAAFSGCSSLESITIPFVGGSKKTSSDTYQYPFGYIFGTYSYDGGVATQQYYYGSSTYSTTDSTYYIPSSLKSVTVTGGEILYGAFYNCSNLTSVVIPDSVKSIGSRAFSSCSSLTSIEIPDSVTSIGSSAFYGCSSLTNIVIPDIVTSIGSYAFQYCSSLKDIEISNSVASIGSYAFQYCSSLRHVAYTGTESQWNSMSIGSYNTALTNATRHYKTRFEIIETCVERGVYCPVCQELITRTEKEGGAHSYTDIYDLSCNACDFNRTVTGISISRLPEKLGYLLFEELDITSGMVLVTFSDGSTGEVALTEQMVTGFDPATIGQQQLTVSYGGMTTDFTVEVLAQMPDSVEVLTKPSKLSYIVGDTLDLTGLTLKALYGAEEAVVNASEVTAQADMTVAGVQMVTVTFEGKSATFEIYVHEKGIITVDSSLYPESSHDYSNNVNETKTLTVPGATQLVLTFNSSSYTESNYDYVYVLDGAGNQIAKYSGSLANKVVTVPGDTVKIKLTSDHSNVYYGYKFSSIQAEVGMLHPETAVPGYAPTCTEPGLSDGSVCTLCGEVITQQVEIPATGHTTVNGVCQNCDFGKNVVHTLNDVETYYSTVEGALANATGGTIKLLADLKTGNLIINPGVTLDLNGHTLTANILLVMDGATILDGGTTCTGGGKLQIAEKSLAFVRENGQDIIPVWNGVDGYVFTKVTFQQMAVKAGAGAAQYIFLPTFSNKEAAALMADGGADNGLKFKVGLTWSDGQCQQFYTYSDDLVKQVFDGTGKWVFSLTITGISGITDMVANAIVVTDSGTHATNTSTAIKAG